MVTEYVDVLNGDEGPEMFTSPRAAILNAEGVRPRSLDLAPDY